MKTLYFDLIGGTSGDMTVAALLDLGVSMRALEKELRKIHIGGYRLKKSFVERGHVRAAKFDVHITKNANFSFSSIVRAVKESALSAKTKENILKVYEALRCAETRVHGHRHHDIRFQQLGDIDSIADIAGACICLEKLGIERILYSILPLNTALAPATFELIKDKDVYFTGRLFENVTPTGIAILSGLGQQCDAQGHALRRVGRVGYGAGASDPAEVANVLRVVELDEPLEEGLMETDEVCVIEANIDDMNPQVFEYVFERLFDGGALDVFLTGVHMKKTRPGFLLTVLSSSRNLGKITGIILSETTTIGVRYRMERRLKLMRRIERLPYGGASVRVKVIGQSRDRRCSPEYDDCRRIAARTKRPLIQVYEDIKRKAELRWPSQG